MVSIYCQLKSNLGDGNYATVREKRISWLKSLDKPEWEPTIYDVWAIDKLDNIGVIIRTEVIKGIPYSLNVGERILLESVSKSSEVEILYLHGESTAQSIIIAMNPEEYDKYLFTEKGTIFKLVR